MNVVNITALPGIEQELHLNVHLAASQLHKIGLVCTKTPILCILFGCVRKKTYLCSAFLK